MHLLFYVAATGTVNLAVARRDSHRQLLRRNWMFCRGHWHGNWLLKAKRCAASCSASKLLQSDLCKASDWLNMVQLRRILLDCAVELSPKTPIYATLIGAWAHWLLFAPIFAPCSFKIRCGRCS